MEIWSEIRREVLTGALSKRAAIAKYGVGWHPLRSLALVVLQVVTGKDCPQRAEIVLRFTPAGLLRWGAIAASRLAAALALWRRGRFYELVLSQDIPKNAACVTAFLRSLTPP